MTNMLNEWPLGPGEATALVRTKDWSQTPLNAIAYWPACLRIAVGAVLDSPLPTIVLWGPELIQIYNDAYQPLLGERHPAALGQPTRDCWPEVWAFNEPIYRQVLNSGERIFFENQEYVIRPSGIEKSMFFTISYTPARDELGTIHGVTVVAIDTTERVLAERDRAKSRIEQSRINEELASKVASLQKLDRDNAFKIALAEALRSLDAVGAIERASALLGEHLNVSRVLYAEVDDAAVTFMIRRDWNAPGITSISGVTRRLNNFGPEIIALLRAGQIMVVDNIAHDPRTAAFVDAYEAINVQANLAVPIIKSSVMIAILSLQNSQPRCWTVEEVALSSEVAERTWASAVASRAQYELRLERDQSQHIFDSMAEGMAIVDENWIVLRMNAEGLRLGRRMAHEVIGFSHWDIWPETSGSDVERFYRRVMQTRVSGTIEYQHAFPGGVSTWFEIRAYPTPEGGMAILFRDIDERVRSNEKLQIADRRKDEFLAMLAHELRNPLAPISAAADLLKLGNIDEDGIRLTSEIISRQVRHLTRLVDDLIDVSRVSRGIVELEMVPVEIHTVVMDAVEQVNPLILRLGHRFVLDLAPETVQVSGDAKRLVQVMTNLLANAAKYTPEGGNIRLALRVENNKIKLTVYDDGVGLGDDLIHHIFDLFVQAERTPDRSAGGLGMGLTLVKSLVELHGGEVGCFSAGPGCGSSFTVTLPLLVTREIVLPVIPATGPPINAEKPLFIMIVDDNVDVTVMIKMVLESRGHRVIVEHSSRIAIERARIETPDICLLDIGLPEIDGNELARRLRNQKETAATCLIALTGYGQEQDRITSLAAGFNEHMVKPVDMDSLEVLMHRFATR